MRYMSWSWRDLCELPARYYAVLVEMYNEEQRHAEQERARLQSRHR